LITFNALLTMLMVNNVIALNTTEED